MLACPGAFFRMSTSFLIRLPSKFRDRGFTDDWVTENMNEYDLTYSATIFEASVPADMDGVFTTCRNQVS